MFEDCLVESAGKIQTKKSRTVAVSAVIHALLVTTLILVPLVFTDQIEGAKLTSILLEPPPPPPAGPPPAPAPSVAKAPAHEVHPVDTPALVEPKYIPKDIATVIDASAEVSGAIGVPYGVPYGIDFGKGDIPFLGNNRLPIPERPPDGAAPPPPAPLPPPAPAPIKTKEPLRVGGDVQAGKVIYQPAPTYPSLARIARVEGVVVLQATIGTDGTVQSLRIISDSNPLLRTGVVETVKTWKYKPTLLNNEPVEVLTTITVNFSLNGNGR